MRRYYVLAIVVLGLSFNAFLAPYMVPRSPDDAQKDKLFGTNHLEALQAPQFKKVDNLAIIPITPVQWGQEIARQHGWTGSQWDCLYSLWEGESGWNPYSVNPTSGASGIAQSLGHGYVQLGDAKSQIVWGTQYIEDRYQNPCNALIFWDGQYPHFY